MKLRPNARKIIRHSRTLRWGLVASVMSGFEAIAPMFSSALPVNWGAVLIFVCVVGAMLSRLRANVETDQ